MKELCYCPPSYGGSGLMNIVAMVPESFLLFVGPMSCGRFSAINGFGSGGRNGYLYVTDADMSLGKVDSEIRKAVDTIVQKYKPKALVLLLTCDVLILGLDEEALMKELRKNHPETVFQSFPINQIISGIHGPVEMMYTRMVGMLDHSGSEDAVNFIGSGMPPNCNSDVNEILEGLGFKSNHPMKMKTFEEFLTMGHAKCNIITSAEGLVAGEKGGVPYCVMYPTYSIDEVKEQYSELFKILGKEYDLSPFEEKTMELVSETSELIKGMTVALGSSVSRRVFSLAKLMLENDINVTDVFITGEAYDETSSYDAKDKEWVLENHPNTAVHYVGDTSMITNIGSTCKVDISIGFNAAYMTESKIVMNTSDGGQVGFEPIGSVMRKIIDTMKDPKDLKGLMASYGVWI